MTRSRPNLDRHGPADPLAGIIARTLKSWDREEAALARQPYMLVRSPDRDATYAAHRRGDRTYAELPTSGPLDQLVMAGSIRPMADGLRLLRTPTTADAGALAVAEATVTAARVALSDLARDAWYRGSPLSLDELTTAAAEVYGPEPVR